MGLSPSPRVPLAAGAPPEVSVCAGGWEPPAGPLVPSLRAERPEARLGRDLPPRLGPLGGPMSK